MKNLAYNFPGSVSLKLDYDISVMRRGITTSNIIKFDFKRTNTYKRTVDAQFLKQ
jgi:hypothetical protein